MLSEHNREKGGEEKNCKENKAREEKAVTAATGQLAVL